MIAQVWGSQAGDYHPPSLTRWRGYCPSFPGHGDLEFSVFQTHREAPVCVCSEGAQGPCKEHTLNVLQGAEPGQSCDIAPRGGWKRRTVETQEVFILQ